MKNATGGFTLIELLVVVLIIGILSSIALPQYTKAVEKSRAAEAMAFAADYIMAQQMYHMANGQFAALEGSGVNSNLDIDLPQTLKNFTIMDNTVSRARINLTRKGSSMPYMLSARVIFQDGKYRVSRICYNNEKACKAISNGAPDCDSSDKYAETNAAWCYGGNG